MEKITKDIVEGIITTGGIGALSGSSYYLYQVSKGKEFRFFMFSINIFLAFFVCYTIGYFIPDSMGEFKNGLLGIAGFSSYPILGILEKKGGDIILKFLKIDLKNNK